MEAKAREPGKIITFYSYKGGTGRSMALANLAWILASQGKRVLTLDWDLEAPGLHRYFYPFLLDKDLTSSDGLIDFVIKFAEAAATPGAPVPVEKADKKGRRKTRERPESNQEKGVDKDWYKPYANILRYASSLNWEFAKGGTIDFIPAGRQGPSYSTRVNSFSWQTFYERLGGGMLLELAKEWMRAQYDYVLIDSRTGVSDTSGICTLQMPDILVVCFTLNNQSIEGAGAVAESVAGAKLSKPDDTKILIFPIPTRVENSEKDKLELAREAAKERFDRFLWHIDQEKRGPYWGEVEIAYVPFYAYEEILATFGDKPFQTTSILASTERLATYVTGVETQLEPVSEVERQRVLSQYSRQKKARKGAGIRLTAPKFLFYLSYSRANSDPYLKRFYDDLASELRRRLGYGSETVGFFVPKEIESGNQWSSPLIEALQESQVLVALYSPAYFKSSHCGKEFQIFLERRRTAASIQPGSESRPAILPILWIPLRESTPPAAADIQYFTSGPAQEYARKGLRQMLKQYSQYKFDYQMVLAEFAEALIKTVEAQVLPPLLELPSFENTANAFGEPTARSAIRPSTRAGPRLVNFVYVVASRDEMQTLKDSTENYGLQGGRDWSPFSPVSLQRVGAMAQTVASEENMLSQEIPCDPDLVEKLRQTEAENNLAVIIVDRWALLISEYQRLLVEFDRQNFLNLALLVVHNDLDPEVEAARPKLERALNMTFRYHLLTESNLWRRVSTADEFRASLRQVLDLTRMRVLELGTIARPFDTASRIEKPKIFGPG
jgi:FxsC-like protein